MPTPSAIESGKPAVPAPAPFLIPIADALTARNARAGQPVPVWEVLTTPPDHRAQRGRRHKLATVLLLAQSAVLAGTRGLPGRRVRRQAYRCGHDHDSGSRSVHRASPRSAHPAAGRFGRAGRSTACLALRLGRAVRSGATQRRDPVKGSRSGGWFAGTTRADRPFS